MQPGLRLPRACSQAGHCGFTNIWTAAGAAEGPGWGGMQGEQPVPGTASVCLLSPPCPTSHLDQPSRVDSPTNETTALWEALAQFARPHQTMLQPVGMLGTLAPPAPWTVTLQLKSHGWDLSRQLVLPRPHLTSSQVSCPFHHRQDKDTSSDMYNSPRPQLANLCARCCPSQLLLSLRQYKQRSL